MTDLLLDTANSQAFKIGPRQRALALPFQTFDLGHIQSVSVSSPKCRSCTPSGTADRRCIAFSSSHFGASNIVKRAASSNRNWRCM
jgi:hypothetical protein